MTHRSAQGPSGRDSIPIVERIAIELPQPERSRLARLADKLLADEPALRATAVFGPRVACGRGPWPALVIEDHSAIALFDPEADVAYAYRALLLGGQGDRIAIGVARNADFERYCREVLQLGVVDVLVPRASARRRSLAACCAADADFVAGLADLARRHGGLNLVPYMGTGSVWALAGAIAAKSASPVRVAAPPPRLTQRVNDKIWFAERVTQVLGSGALPRSFAAFSVLALARRLVSLARTHASVAVKLPDSARSSGNFVLEAADVARLAPRVLRDRLHALLADAGWRGDFPLQATAWEQPIAASPSVQIWIPGCGQGLPVVEGVFDQLLAGTVAAFAGAAPSELPAPWQHRLADEAVRLAALFQALGYFGRCSLDAIVVGESPRGWQLHWVECNGRWGGVSIPMTLANRLVGDWRRRPFVVVDRAGLRLPPRTLRSVLDRMSGELFVPDTHPRGLVVLAPGRLEAGSGFEIMVLDETLAAVRARAQRIAAMLER